MLLLQDFSTTPDSKIKEYLSREREQELCSICSAVHPEVSGAPLIVLLAVNCYSEVLCIWAGWCPLSS